MSENKTAIVPQNNLSAQVEITSVDQLITEFDQELFILRSLVHSSFLFNNIKDVLKMSYFIDIDLRKVFGLLKSSYDKYGKVINYQEFCLELVAEIPKDEDRLKLKGLLGKVYLVHSLEPFNKLYSKNYVSNKIEEFVKIKIVEDTISDVAINLKTNKPIDYSKVYQRLTKLSTINIINSSVPFRISEVSKVWELNPTINSKIIGSGLPTLNRSLQYKGLSSKTMNIITGPPGTGKSTFLVSEAAKAVLQHKNVIYIVLGDLNSWDIFLKFVPAILNTEAYTIDHICAMNKEDLLNLVSECNVDKRFDRVLCEAFPASTLTAESLYDEVIKLNNDFFQNTVDMVVIDYADNLILEGGDSGAAMYEGRGKQYQMLEKLAWDTDSILWSASQPKGHYWDQEYVLDSNINAESAKKRHVVDLNLAMGKPYTVQDGLAIGTITISKARRGQSGIAMHVMYDYKRNTIVEIPIEQYHELKKVCAVAQYKNNDNNGANNTTQPVPPGANSVPISQKPEQEKHHPDAPTPALKKEGEEKK